MLSIISDRIAHGSSVRVPPPLTAPTAALWRCRPSRAWRTGTRST